MLNQLSPEKWETFSGKGKWDVLVAMRGPDTYDNRDAIKWTTSSVLRYVMAKAIRTGGVINEGLPFVVIPAPAATMKKSGGLLIPDWRFFNGEHFFGHVQEAADLCGVPVKWMDKDEWVRRIPETSRSLHHLNIELLEWAQKNPQPSNPSIGGGVLLGGEE